MGEKWLVTTQLSVGERWLTSPYHHQAHMTKDGGRGVGLLHHHIVFVAVCRGKVAALLHYH